MASQQFFLCLKLHPKVVVTAIHQETVLFDELSVAENIFLGHAPRGRFGLIDLKIMNKKSCDILHSIGARIDPEQKLKDLGIANKHLVAIARALSTDARVVIMDEPTASLSHKEIEELYELVESLKSQGKAILFISHKFDEIFRIADNYTVFRDGQIIGDGAISDVTDADLVKMMVGSRCQSNFPKTKDKSGQSYFASEELYASDGVRGYFFYPTQRRNSWFLRFSWSWPLGVYAGSFWNNPQHFWNH